MAFTEDLSAFFNEDDFAISATYTPVSGSPVTVKGIFDNAYYGSGDGGVEVAGTQPRFQCAAADLPSFREGDTITIEATIYNVVNPVPDGTGLVDFILQYRD